MSDRLQHDNYVTGVTAGHLMRAQNQIPGTPRSHSCPVALMLGDATGVLWGVGNARAFRRDFDKAGGPRNLIVLPAWLTHHIRLWDRTGEMEPFRCVLHWGSRGEWLLDRDTVGGPGR